MTRKLGLALILFVLSGSSWAEWVTVGPTDQGVIYIDRNATVTKENTVKMWEMLDYYGVVVLRHVRAKSKVYLMEYDCDEERSRLLTMAYHSGNMGGGDVVARTSIKHAWEPVPEDSSFRFKMNLACGKKIPR